MLILAAAGLTAISLLALGILAFTLLRVVAFLRACLASARDRAGDRRAAEAFGDRWQGLWSSEDEAINGLRSTLHLGQLQRDGQPMRILPRVGWLSPFTALGDRIFFEWLKAILQGNDQPGRRMTLVAAAPPFCTGQRELDPDLHLRLIEQVAADGRKIRLTLDRLRRLLGEVAFGGQIPTPFERDPHRVPVYNSLLVHTLYFQDAEADGDERTVFGRIAAFIRDRSGPLTAAPSPAVTLAAPDNSGRPSAPTLLGDGAMDDRGDDGSPGEPDRELSPRSGDLRPDLEAFAGRRGRTSPIVQASMCCGLLLASGVVWLAGAWFFQWVRPQIAEEQLVRMIAESDRIVLDAASDDEGFPTLADWSFAMALASERPPDRKVTPSGPLAAPESWSVPGITVGRDDGLAVLESLDEPHLEALEVVSVAERLASTDPPHSELAGRFADRAAALAEDIRHDLPGNAISTLVRVARVRSRLGDVGPAREAALETIAVSQRVLKRREGGGYEPIPAKPYELAPDAPSAPVDSYEPPPPADESMPPPPPPPNSSHARRAGTVSDGSSPRPVSFQELSDPEAGQAEPPPPPSPEEHGGIPVREAFEVRFEGFYGDYKPTGQGSESAGLQAIEILTGLGYRDEARDAVEDYIRQFCTLRDSSGHPAYSCSFLEGVILARLIRDLGLKADYVEFDEAVRRALFPSTYALPEFPIDPRLVDDAALGMLSDLVGNDALASRFEKSIFGGFGPRRLVEYAAILDRLGRPDLAVKAAKAAVEDTNLLKPVGDNLFLRIYVHLELARLGLHGPLLTSPVALIESAWDDATKIESRSTSGRSPTAPATLGPTPQAPAAAPKSIDWSEANAVDPFINLDPGEWLFDRSRASALAEVLAVASELETEEAGAIRDRLLERYRALAADPKAALADEARRSEPLSRGLRWLSAAYARAGATTRALEVADEILLAHHKISSRLFVALRLVGGESGQAAPSLASRARARQLVEAAEAEIRSAIPRRRDRSPRLSVCAAIWARLGETGRAISARDECRLADRARSDATILTLFGVPDGDISPDNLPKIGRPIPIFRIDARP